jgi:SOS-response transcriptional repressor LexA
MNTRTGLTERQKNAFDAIVAFQNTFGRAPSVRELATAIGGAVSVTQWLIDQLQDRGYITRLAGKSCSIAVIDPMQVPAFPPRTQAMLEAYCRLNNERSEDVIADAVLIFLDQREDDIARERKLDMYQAFPS